MNESDESRRADILARMQQVMGPLPTRWDGETVCVQRIAEEPIDSVIRQRIRYEDEPDSWIPAYLLMPAHLDEPAPAMLCAHQTTAVGSQEPAGVAGLANLHYALELAQRGYITLAPDLPSFGDLKHADPLPQGYVSGTMKDIHLHRRGLDLLAQMSEVDEHRMGCIGHSLGGHNTLFLAAFDTRVRVAASSCGFSSWEAYADHAGDLSAWAQDRYMPRVRDVYHNRPEEMPHTFEEILEAILPRAIYINAPVHDHDMPKAGVDVCVKYLRDVAAKRGLPWQLLSEHPDCGHDFPPEQRERCYAFIDRILHEPLTA